MLEYERINVSEGINIHKSNKSKECMIFIIGILKILVINLNDILVMNKTD